MNERRIEFSPPNLTEADIQAVTRVLKSGWITTGREGLEFRDKLREYLNAKNVILLNSATSGLFLAMKSMGIGEGDEVITSPYTFAATANVIVHTGAQIVFADVSPDSFFLDPYAVQKKITSNTKAIISVDFAGGLFNGSSILKEKNSLFVPNNPFQEILGRPLLLSDSAHALGSRFIDNSVDMSVYSFHAVKNLTTAEGGALALNSFGDIHLDNQFFTMLQHLSLHGQTKSAQEKYAEGTWEYDITCAGYKMNMADMLAALGYSQFKRYETHILPTRKELFHAYKELLQDYDWAIMKDNHIFGDEPNSYHLFPLRIKKFNGVQRNKLIEYLKAHGIMTNVHYKPLHLMTAYYDPFVCPYAQAVYINEITLPLHTGLVFDDIHYIVEHLAKGVKYVKTHH